MQKLASPAWLPGATSPLEANLHRPMDRRETQWVPLWMFQSLAATPVIFAPPAVKRRYIKITHIKIHTSSCAMMLLHTTCCRHLQHAADTCITKHAKTSIQQNSIRSMQTRPFPFTQKRLLQTEGTRTEQAAGRKARKEPCRTTPDVLKNPSTAGSNPAQSSPAASKDLLRAMRPLFEKKLYFKPKPGRTRTKNWFNPFLSSALALTIHNEQ